MRFSLTDAQAAFFRLNGYIEIEGIPFHPDAIFSSLQSTGRDVWRENGTLSHFLLHTLASSITQLVLKPVRLALDHWMYPFPNTVCPLQDLFCIQGLAVFALLTPAIVPIETPSKLGLAPFPSRPENVLFVKPHILIDWTQMTPVSKLYIAGFALAKQGVYVRNDKDPALHFLKNLGYQFGDCLTDPHHPLIKQ